ncbi:DUF418 domain-containing protein [Serinicoccus sediminis]|uniref:DUF418 domain-containing protein n=1 Tax=Serinicoccus sediminis TaxID=2306021 RepID=UPI0010215376|nr:acyltransferase family protein [Serinicoccus sediminis]
MTTAEPGPTSRPARLHGLDVARGLAIVGMIVVNVGPIQVDSLLQRLYLLPYGRASVLFVTIAGIGMGFFLRSRTGTRRWRELSWRIVLLLVLGLALQTLTRSVSVILTTYALLFLLAPLAWRLPSRRLLLVAGVLTVAGPLWIVWHDLEVHGHAAGAVSLLTPRDEVVHSLLIAGPYPLASWSVPFLVGLWLSRTALADPLVQRRLMLWGAVTALASFIVADLAYSALGPEADVGWTRILTGVGHGQMPLWIVSATAGACFVVGACLHWGLRGPVSRWLADGGTMALTLYVLHVLVLAVVKPEEGFPFVTGVLTATALWAGLLALAVLWQRDGRSGPLERLLRTPWLRPTAPTRRPSQERLP